MDQVSTGDATRDTRRSRMRSAARSRRTVAPDGFQTPAWLDRSFVLPLTKPEQNDVPEPRLHQDPFPQQSSHRRTRPQPDVTDPRVGGQDVEAPEMSAQSTPASDLDAPTPAFVRPPGDDIDFGAVIRRSDRSRSALRTAWASTALAGLVLIVYLLTTVPAVAVLAALCAAVAVTATVLRMRLMRAPVPRVNR